MNAQYVKRNRDQVLNLDANMNFMIIALNLGLTVRTHVHAVEQPFDFFNILLHLFLLIYELDYF